MEEIIVISLSPAVDRNYKVTQLHPGQMHRAGNPVISPGGKGVNVARVLSLLGAKVNLLGFFAGENGRYIIKDLQQNNINVESVIIEGNTRNSINILDSVTKEETEILESGPSVNESNIQELNLKFSSILQKLNSPSLVVLSGGIPTGADTKIYSQLILTAKEYNAKCFLDSSQDALLEGIKAFPYFIKPNLRELSQMFNDNDLSNIIQAIRNSSLSNEDMIYISKKVKSLGILRTAITLSDKGAILCMEDRLLFAGPLDINPVNTIGSGDSFTAGFAFGVANSMTDEECLRIAVACATSNALFEEIGVIDPQMVKGFIKEVKIEQIL
jgi:1-phosphofructokinase family hexose kinase